MPKRFRLPSYTGLGAHLRSPPGNELPGYCLPSLTGLACQETGNASHRTWGHVAVDGTLEHPDMRSHAGAWERVNGSFSLSPYLPISLSPYLPISLSPYLPISLSPYLPISPSPHLPISPSPHLPISPSPHLPISPSPHLPISLSPYPLSPYLPISLSPYLPISLSPYLPISLSPHHPITLFHAAPAHCRRSPSAAADARGGGAPARRRPGCLPIAPRSVSRRPRWSWRFSG